MTGAPGCESGVMTSVAIPDCPAMADTSCVRRIILCLATLTRRVGFVAKSDLPGGIVAAAVSLHIPLCDAFSSLDYVYGWPTRWNEG